MIEYHLIDNKLIERKWINDTTYIDRELTADEIKSFYGSNETKEFYDFVHKKAVSFRNEKIKEILSKNKGQITEMEIYMMKEWAKEEKE